MLDINKLRQLEPKIITIGGYPTIIQSILDFDYISGKQKPSVVGIIATGRKFERFFFGKKEILIPVFADDTYVPQKIKENVTLFINLSSGRRTLSSTESVLQAFPNILGGSVFAENVPEQHSLQLANTSNKFIIGPASIGLLIPNSLKLGAIGGVHYQQLVDAHLFEKGSVAVLSASGGMTNEIINTVTGMGKRISFSLSFGGDRFPITSPKDAFLAAENDPETKTIIYYGELGGTDEYELAELLHTKRVTKTVICYVAGAISEMFETPPQFGHAKAMASKKEETAQGKRNALREAGAIAANSYTEFLNAIKSTQKEEIVEKEYNTIMEELNNRQSALITTSISADHDGKPSLLNEDLLSFAKTNSFAAITASLFLGKKIKSKKLEEFVDFVLRLLVDHGPYVSGAVNTIITARAGRDMVSALSSGLLTIGPRFGGAINQAATNWLDGVVQKKGAAEFVEEFASKRKYISGIGHKKYRVDLPDPRVVEIKKFIENLTQKRFTNFALEVEKITTAKKGNLILNVDGAIAAVLLDILSEKEELDDTELQKLTEIEFFNSLFVLSRSVGFISHFLDQKRLDEGIFRLPEEMVAEAKMEE